MLRPFLLSLVFAGVGAVNLGAGDVGADRPTSDVSVWRWSVSTILDAQRASSLGVGALPAKSFGQRYQRYSPSGLPEVPAEARPR